MIDPVDLPDLSRRYQLAPGALLSGCYYQTAPSTNLSTTASSGNGNLRVAPFLVPRGVTITSIGAEVTAAGDVGSTVRLGIYADNGSGYPGSLVLDAGTIPGDAVGVHEIAVNTILRPGLYWCGAVVQGVTTTQPTLRSVVGLTSADGIPLTTGATPGVNWQPSLGFVNLGVTGPLPATFAASLNLSSVMVRVFVKVG